MIPNNLPVGYYLVTRKGHSSVALWQPKANHWKLLNGGNGVVPPNHFDEIKNRVKLGPIHSERSEHGE
jgi:hypothetical protein